MSHKCQTVSKTVSTTKDGYNPRHAYVSANFGGFSHSNIFPARALSLYAKAHIHTYIYFYSVISSKLSTARVITGSSRCRHFADGLTICCEGRA